jgi:hypothetical protein
MLNSKEILNAMKDSQVSYSSKTLQTLLKKDFSDSENRFIFFLELIAIYDSLKLTFLARVKK